MSTDLSDELDRWALAIRRGPAAPQPRPARGLAAGVCLRNGKYEARVRSGGRDHYGGRFDTAGEAASAASRLRAGLAPSATGRPYGAGVVRLLSGKYVGKFVRGGKGYHVGTFATEAEAAEAVRRKRLELARSQSERTEGRDNGADPGRS